MINIKTLAKRRGAQNNYKVFNENQYILFYQAYGITPMEISQLTKTIKDIDSSLKLTHIPSSRVARLVSSWNSKKLQSLLQGPTWSISSNNAESFSKLIDIKNDKLSLLGGICEGHIISIDTLNKYTKIENKPYSHIVKLHYGISQVLDNLHRGISTDLAQTIKKVSLGE